MAFTLSISRPCVCAYQPSQTDPMVQDNRLRNFRNFVSPVTVVLNLLFYQKRVNWELERYFWSLDTIMISETMR